MFGDSRTAGTKIRSDIANCTRTIAEESKDRTTSRVSDSPEQSIFFFAPYCNHLVTEIVTGRLHMSSRRIFTGSFLPLQSPLPMKAKLRTN